MAQTLNRCTLVYLNNRAVIYIGSKKKHNQHNCKILVRHRMHISSFVLREVLKQQNVHVGVP